MAKKKSMVIVASKPSKWHINGEFVDFEDGQEITVGKDVPETIASDMLRHGYAMAKGEEKQAEVSTSEPTGAETKAQNPVQENK